jgi:hypothetical protein
MVTWVEVPVADRLSEADPVRPKYRVDASALVVYSRGKAYVGVHDPRDIANITGNHDVVLLRRVDLNRLPAILPWTISEFERHIPQARVGSPRVVGLGDIIERLTNWLGIAKCGRCSKRHRTLNRIAVWGWWR